MAGSSLEQYLKVMLSCWERGWERGYVPNVPVAYFNLALPNSLNMQALQGFSPGQNNIWLLCSCTCIVILFCVCWERGWKRAWERAWVRTCEHGSVAGRSFL